MSTSSWLHTGTEAFPGGNSYQMAKVEMAKASEAMQAAHPLRLLLANSCLLPHWDPSEDAL